MKYYVMELCIKNDGTNDNGIYVKESANEAMKLFYQKCAAHVNNEDYSNAIISIMNSNGMIVEQKVFTSYKRESLEDTQSE